MTREEAISCIKQIRFRGYLRGASPFYEQDTEALNMAISALEQEPCDDAISREAVYSILKEYHIDEEEIESAMDECQNLTVNSITSDVSLLPSVTQKSGKWENLYRCWMCSECGKQTYIEHKYCPNCGARMESEDKTE